MDIWADLFEELIIVAPVEFGHPPKFWSPYNESNKITVIPYRSNPVKGLNQERVSIFEIPRMINSLINGIKRSDVFLVRSPGGISLIASILSRFFNKNMVAKYAGTWPTYRGEPLSYQFQKKILKSKWFRGIVTVYGDWPNQPNHIFPFFTSILTNDQVSRARDRANNRSLHNPVRILFVGRMDRGKNAHILLEAVKSLKQSGYETVVRIVGDGNEDTKLRDLATSLEIDNQVTFTGAIPFEQVLEQYEWGDILVLVSENAEGWPKAIAEAMAFGLVCFGSSRGLIPQMLESGRGIIIDPISSTTLASRIIDLITFPNKYMDISQKAAAWSQKFSLEGLQEALKVLMKKNWNLDTDNTTSVNKIE
jgi:glycosyltransferase involved in cell wall biosynthesis